jgi:hypothetical protein
MTLNSLISRANSLGFDVRSEPIDSVDIMYTLVDETGAFLDAAYSLGELDNAIYYASEEGKRELACAASSDWMFEQD